MYAKEPGGVEHELRLIDNARACRREHPSGLHGVGRAWLRVCSIALQLVQLISQRGVIVNLRATACISDRYEVSSVPNQIEAHRRHSYSVSRLINLCSCWCSQFRAARYWTSQPYTCCWAEQTVFSSLIRGTRNAWCIPYGPVHG